MLLKYVYFMVTSESRVKFRCVASLVDGEWEIEKDNHIGFVMSRDGSWTLSWDMLAVG